MALGQSGVILRVGDKIHYRSASMVHPEATYEGVITEVHPTYYRALGTPIRNTMNIKDRNEFWGTATPYYFCIPKYPDITMDRVKVISEKGEMLSA